MSKSVLCLLVDGFEEIELITPVDLLRRAGARVTVASVTGAETHTGRCQVVIRADARLGDVTHEEFDLLLIPGGPGIKALRGDGRAAELALEFARAGKPIGAICAAPTVLKDAGVLEGKRFTAHASVHDELPEALASERVVQDGGLITSRGAGTAVDFGLKLIAHLFGPEKADEVALAIMA